MTGVTPELHYDPLGRLVRVDLPDGTQQLTEHAPWRTRSWDAADALPAGGTGNAWYNATADADPWELPSGTALTTAERTQIEDAIDASQSALQAQRLVMGLMSTIHRRSAVVGGSSARGVGSSHGWVSPENVVVDFLA